MITSMESKGKTKAPEQCLNSQLWHACAGSGANALVKFEAARAMELLNFTPLNNKTIRVMYSHRDPSVRKIGTVNIFIKNLNKTINNKTLHGTFSSFGNILSCKLSTDMNGQSKGYGFVQFDSAEAAQSAIDKLNGMLINDKQVYVGHFLRKQERDTAHSNPKFNKVFGKNLAESRDNCIFYYNIPSGSRKNLQLSIHTVTILCLLFYLISTLITGYWVDQILVFCIWLDLFQFPF